MPSSCPGPLGSEGLDERLRLCLVAVLELDGEHLCEHLLILLSQAPERVEVRISRTATAGLAISGHERHCSQPPSGSGHSSCAASAPPISAHCRDLRWSPRPHLSRSAVQRLVVVTDGVWCLVPGGQRFPGGGVEVVPAPLVPGRHVLGVEPGTDLRAGADAGGAVTVNAVMTCRQGCPARTGFPRPPSADAAPRAPD